ncbi:MAG: glycosyltransferase family 39 protein [Planctomycetes bacterium]|nr:glycosyltransferase family 39 protein [Planctomycetota bacterium]
MSRVPSSTGPFLGGWHLLLPIVALAAVRDLWAPDEPRYAQIAREAFESGSLLVLHLCGDVYPDKPPLVYWLAGWMGSLFGWNELALRVPSLLATVGTAWVAQRIARRHLGAVAAAWTPTFYLGTAMVVWFGGRLQLDPLLAFFCLAAVDQAWTDGGPDRMRARRLLLAGLFAGLAALCKGPVAWLHVGFALLALRLVPRALRRGTGWGAGAWAGCVMLAVLPVVAWATAASLAEPSLWRPLFLGQHLGRVTSPLAPHIGPPWEHLWQVPGYVLPWTALFALGIAAAIRAWRRARSGTELGDAQERESARGLALALAWFVPVLLVFSIMPPKRELYLLPVYPVAAWFAAWAMAAGLARGSLPGWATWGASVLLGAVGLAAGIVPRLVAELAPLAPAALPAALALVGAAGASCAFLRRGNLARWADALALGLSGAGLAAALLVVPEVDPIKSARTLAQEIALRPERPSEIPCFGVQPEGYRFYAGLPTVRAYASDWIIAPKREGAQFLGLVAERDWVKAPEERRARFRILHRRQVGSRDVLVLGLAP